MIQPGLTIIILRERQLLLRVLKLWVVIDDKKIYDLPEEQPLLLPCDQLPLKIMARNGYHSSKPFYINQPFQSPLYIDVGCEADNGRLWGGILISVFLWVIFFASGLHLFLVLANLPILYIMYLFFFNPNEFISITILPLPVKKTI